ncbi:C39 family peptidase [candidate division KSB1 bacterium]
MYKINLIRFLFLIITISLILPFSYSYSQVNDSLKAEFNMGNEIPLEKVKKFAMYEAKKSWADASIGPAIPVCDLRGNIIAYEIIFSLNGKEFPEKTSVFENIRKVKNLLKLAEEKKDKELIEKYQKERWGLDSYMTMVIGARYDVVPLLEYHTGLPPYFTVLEDAVESVKSELKTANPILSRIYAAGFLDKWFELKSSQGSVLVNMYNLKTFKCEDLSALAEKERMDLRKQNESSLKDTWLSLFSKIESTENDTSAKLNKSTTITTVMIGGFPDYLRRRGCSPTSAAMVLGYWHPRGYENLMQYGSEYLINELADAMFTTPDPPGETNPLNIQIGVEHVANDHYGYDFDCSSSVGIYTPYGTINSNWDNITYEIDHGRPLVWSVGGYTPPGEEEEVDHSVACFGYQRRDYDTSDTELFAVVRDTWIPGIHYWIVMKIDNFFNTYYATEYYTDCVTSIVPGYFVNATIKNSIGGSVVKVDGITRDSPYTAQWECGSSHTIAAVSPQTVSGTTYFFKNWSDQGGQIHTVSPTSRDITYTANLYKIFTSVSINGPSSIPYKEDATWNAVTDGGSGTFSYAWYKDGIISSLASSYTTRSSTPFTLELIVIDLIHSITKSDSRNITIGSGEPKISVLPKTFALRQNYPNPFNPETNIKFALPESLPINLIVYDINGRFVKNLVNGSQRAGYHNAKWDGTNNYGDKVSSGVYFYRLIANGKVLFTKKMLMVK